MRINEIWEFFGVDGWLRQGVSIEIEGHDVQIVRFDEDDSSFVVKMDNRVEQLEPDDVIPYIVNRL